jgi:cytochrome c oxidase subunit 2
MLESASKYSHFMPPQATDVAGSVDTLYGFLLIASAVSCIIVIGGLILFAFKYRRKSENDKTPYITHNTTLEFLWSFIPFVIFMAAFVWGWIVYSGMRSMPTDALEIAVQGQKWNWSFTYKNGRTSSAELYVPVGQNVRLIMNSVDVIHSFYVPAFRYKQDVVPGRYSSIWFRAEHEGDYQVFCAEYCGDLHSGMMAKLHVVPREKYEDWLSNDPYKSLPPVQVGQKVYQTRCVACHSLSEKIAIGPGWKGVFDSHVKLASGGEALADENYIRLKMMNPGNSTVAGFEDKKGVMPTMAGQLSEQEINGVIELFKSLK